MQGFYVLFWTNSERRPDKMAAVSKATKQQLYFPPISQTIENEQDIQEQPEK